MDLNILLSLLILKLPQLPSPCNILSVFYLFIYLFLAVLGLRLCARAFSSCGKRGPLFIAGRRPLTIVASPVAEHKLQTRRLSSLSVFDRSFFLSGMTWFSRFILHIYYLSPGISFFSREAFSRPHLSIRVVNCFWVCHYFFSVFSLSLSFFLSFFVIKYFMSHTVFSILIQDYEIFI